MPASAPSPTARRIRFDVFEADLRSRELWKQGSRLKLGDQPFSVLALLLASAGDVVTREELQRQLWPGDTFVDFDRGLNKAINRLRDGLGDSADAPRFIETLPKRGYRFIGTIETSAAAVDAPAVPMGDDTLRATAPAGSWRLRPILVFTLAAIVAVLATAAWWEMTQRARHDDPAPVIRSSLLPPQDLAFVPYSLALSRDGTHLAFAAEASDGSRSLWIRAMAATTAVPIAGTDGASLPFWAPDGRRVGFFADRRLKIVDLAGGAIRVVTEAPRPSGATWNAADIIVFAPDVNGPLYRVSAMGGTPAPVSQVPAGEGIRGHRWPVFLPDDRHLLFVAFTASAPSDYAPELRVGSLDSLQSSAVEWSGSRAVAYARDHLLFVRDGVLYAQPFDAASHRTTHPPAPVAGVELARPPAFYPPALTVSMNGVLVFQSAADLPSRLVWFDAMGRELGGLPSLNYAGPAVSPDGRRLAGACDGLRSGTLSICVFDLGRGVSTRITDGPSDRNPVWSPDGGEIAYNSEAGIYRRRADGSGTAQFVSRRGIPTGWLPDGRILSFGSQHGVVSLALSSPVTHEVTELGPGAEGQLSPDTGWISYVLPDGLVVQRFPSATSRVTLAAAGAGQPRWSRDGRRVYYISADKKLMAVDFDPVQGKAGPSTTVAQTRIIGSAFVGFQYDVAPDNRVAINSVTVDAPPLTLMSGWLSTLAR